MSLYCYHIITGAYEDIEFHVLGHVNKYDQKEFDDICLEIMEKHGKREHEESYVPATLKYYNIYVYTIDGEKLMEYLIKDYGFVKLDIPGQSGFLIKPIQGCEPKPSPGSITEMVERFYSV